MTAITPGRMIARRYSYTGQPVTVQWKDGTTTIGTLTGWGRQIIRIWTESGQVERSVISISQVTEAA